MNKNLISISNQLNNKLWNDISYPSINNCAEIGIYKKIIRKWSIIIIHTTDVGDELNVFKQTPVKDIYNILDLQLRNEN